MPRPGADGWQLSNPPILAMAPLRASLELFDEAGIEALRAKSVRADRLPRSSSLDAIPARGIETITPREPERRGCQLSIRARRGPHAFFEALVAAGVQGDFREPDVIRVAPTPLYNTFHEVWRFARVLLRTAP